MIIIIVYMLTDVITLITVTDIVTVTVFSIIVIIVSDDWYKTYG